MTGRQHFGPMGSVNPVQTRPKAVTTDFGAAWRCALSVLLTTQREMRLALGRWQVHPNPALARPPKLLCCGLMATAVSPFVGKGSINPHSRGWRVFHGRFRIRPGTPADACMRTTEKGATRSCLEPTAPERGQPKAWAGPGLIGTARGLSLWTDPT